MSGGAGYKYDRFFQRLEQQETVQKTLAETVKVQQDNIQQQQSQFLQLNSKFEVELRLNAQLREDMSLKVHSLKLANDQILNITGRRNVRGALELVAGRLDPTPSKGVQAKLNLLEDDTAFVRLLDSIGAQHNLRRGDMFSCLKGLYHMYSKGMHGSEAMMCIRFADVTAPAERAVLVAVFEHHQVAYMCLDEAGASVEYYIK